MPFWQSIADIRNPMLSIHLLHLSPISPISTAILAVQNLLFSQSQWGQLLAVCWQCLGCGGVCGSQRRIRVGPVRSVKPVGVMTTGVASRSLGDRIDLSCLRSSSVCWQLWSISHQFRLMKRDSLMKSVSADCPVIPSKYVDMLIGRNLTTYWHNTTTYRNLTTYWHIDICRYVDA